MSTNETLTQPTVIDLQSDSQRRWNFRIDQKLAPGQHILTVTDENNSSDAAILYVTAESKPQQIINTVTNIIPPIFFWGLLILFGIIVFLTVYTMPPTAWRTRPMRTNKPKKPRRAITIP